MVGLHDELEELADEAERRFARFLREQVNPGAAQRDAEGACFSRELLRQCAEIGLLSYSLPAALGGGGADPFRWGVMLEQIGYHCEDGSLPLVLSLYAAVANMLHRCATPAQVERYVVPMVQGRRFGCFAYSDGTDAFSFRSTAVRRGDRHVLDGEKMLVTGGMQGDVFMTYVRCENDDLGVFLVEREDPGVSVEPVDISGLRAAGLAKLSLRGVELPDDRLVVPVDGISHAQLFLNDRRGLLVCGPLGRMRGILETITAALQQTVRYGRPLADLPNVQATLGRMHVAVEAARAITHRALWGMRRADRSPVFDPDTAIAKHYVVEQSVEVATSALRLAGGYGYLRDHHYERWLRDFHGGIAGGGAQDILEVNLGAHVSSMLEQRTRREVCR